MSYGLFLTILLAAMIMYYSVVIFLDINKKHRRQGNDFENLEIKGYSFDNEEDIQTYGASLDDNVNDDISYNITDESLSNKDSLDMDYSDESFEFNETTEEDYINSKIVNYDNLMQSFNQQKIQFGIDSLAQTRALFQ